MRQVLAISPFSLVRRTCTTAAFLMATSVTAEEQGILTLTIANEVLEFPLSPGHSDWTGSNAFASVSFLGRPTDKSAWARFKALALGFEVLARRADVPKGSLLHVTEDGSLVRLFSRHDQGSLAVTVDKKAVDGKFLRVSGSFQGAFGPSDNYGRNIDLSDALELSGTFDVTLAPVE